MSFYVMHDVNVIVLTTSNMAFLTFFPNKAVQHDVKWVVHCIINHLALCPWQTAQN